MGKERYVLGKDRDDSGKERYASGNDHYTLGIDFGTLSARCILVHVDSGVETASAEERYEHGVIENELPDGTALPVGAVRQDPQDYLRAMRATVRSVLEQSQTPPDAIIGVGIDFTSCTLVPVFADGRPLSTAAEFRSKPDAWVHVWKDQTAQAEASEMTERARGQNETFLARVGNKVAADSFFPKVWQIARRSPDVFAAAAHFMEAGDWIVHRLTGGSPVRGLSAAAFKALWHKGYPVRFLSGVDVRLSRLVQRSMEPVSHAAPGTPAGNLIEAVACELGLRAGTTIAVANIDAHAAVPGAGVAQPGQMVAVVGTSMCHMLLGDMFAPVKGICGAVNHGILPGYIGYEAGQPAVGDALSWMVNNFLPARYQAEADRRGLSTFAYLESLAASLRPGESGLIALDWWNGNRSPLANGDLRGLLLGLSLQTRAEDLYRALMEGAAFGTLEIIRAFERDGVAVDDICAAGGVADRSPLMMQILADITGRRIRMAESPHASALGAAILAATAAGSDQGGYDRVVDAVQRMTRLSQQVFEPDAERHQIYQRIHEAYRRLSLHLGGGSGIPPCDDVMRLLKELRTPSIERDA